MRNAIGFLLLLVLWPLQTALGNDLYENIRWAIFHEGCEVYVPGTTESDNIRPVEELRQCYLRMQAHNPPVAALIRDASNEALLAATQRAARDIPAAFQLEENLKWVMDHEGQRGAFRRLAAQREARTIRFTYRTLQNHNPNARNILASISDRRLLELVVSIDRSLPPDPVVNPLTGQPDDPIVTVAAEALGEAGLTALQNIALEATRPETWQTKAATMSGHLRDVVQKLYGTKNEAFTAHLVELIRHYGGAPEILTNGQHLRAPDLPVALTGPAAAEVAQVVNLGAGRVSALDLLTGETLSPEIRSVAGTVVITGPLERVRQFLAQLPSSAAARSYQGPTYETTILIPQQQDSATPCSAVPLQWGTSAPSTPNPGKYYVLDFFQTAPTASCPHGKRVLDVVQQQLARSGKSELAANVIPLEVDFFHNQTALKHYLDEYIQHQDPNDQPTLRNAVKELQKRNLETVGKYEVPVLYLQALYDFALRDTNAYVVSSSFFTVGSPFSLFPRSFAANTKILLMAAVADDAGSIEDYQLEPIRTLYDKRRDSGVLLVGALLGGKTQFGMSSRDGDGVSCVGDGDGWGDANTCIKPTEKGTSFATPGVGAAIFIARHALPQDSRSAKDWRNRILRAVRITPSLAGLYIAPGVPQASWIASSAPAITFGNDGAHQPVTIKSGKISFATLDGNEETTIVFSPSGCSGIQTVDGHWYIFRSNQWQEVNVKSIELAVCTSAGERNLTLSDFGDNNLKGVIYL